MFKKLTYRLLMIRSLSQFSFGVKKYFIFLTIISGISVMIAVITPTFYKIFIDQVIIGKNIGAFLLVILAYFSFFIINTFLAYLKNYSYNKLCNSVLFRLKHKILSNYLHLSFEQYQKCRTGDLKMCIEDDVSKLTDFCGIQSIDYFKAAITAAVAALLILRIQWCLALFSIMVIPLTFYIDDIISRKEKELQKINRGNNEKWNSWLQTSIQGWKEVKALNLQKHELRNFVRYAHNFAQYNGRWINYWVTRVLVVPKIKDEFLMKFALYFFGGLLIIKGQMSIGELLVFAMYYDLLSSNIKVVSSTDAELQSNMPFYDRVIEQLNQDNRVFYSNSIPINVNADICMKNVKFSYDKNLLPVVNNLNMEIKQGERVAIIGRSGCGKTTVLKLITGMLSPDTGEILFSGIDISKINYNFLYQRIGFVLQQNLLFNMTIGENLRLACHNADTKMLDEACKKACIYDFVYTQPKGYDTVIGEKGIKLSGGQRQRLVLARLFLRNVDVFIFDEATSAIDQYSESIIHDAINAIGTEKTIIVVAHRQSSIALCDRIVSLS